MNALPLALLAAALLYLDQYQNGLLEAEVGALREQARIYAGALGESAVRIANRTIRSSYPKSLGRCCTGSPIRPPALRPSCMRPMVR